MEEHDDIMKRVVSNIEAAIGERLSQGITPTVLIGSNRSIEQLVDYYAPNGIDWTEQLVLSFGDGEIPLIVYRTMDLSMGQLKVL